MAKPGVKGKNVMCGEIGNFIIPGPQQPGGSTSGAKGMVAHVLYEDGSEYHGDDVWMELAHAAHFGDISSDFPLLRRRTWSTSVCDISTENECMPSNLCPRHRAHSCRPGSTEMAMRSDGVSASNIAPDREVEEGARDTDSEEEYEGTSVPLPGMKTC